MKTGIDDMIEASRLAKNLKAIGDSTGVVLEWSIFDWYKDDPTKFLRTFKRIGIVPEFYTKNWRIVNRRLTKLVLKPDRTCIFELEGYSSAGGIAFFEREDGWTTVGMFFIDLIYLLNDPELGEGLPETEFIRTLKKFICEE